MKDIVAGHVECQRLDVSAKMMVNLLDLRLMINFVIVGKIHAQNVMILV